MGVLSEPIFGLWYVVCIFFYCAPSGIRHPPLPPSIRRKFFPRRFELDGNKAHLRRSADIRWSSYLVKKANCAGWDI